MISKSLLLFYFTLISLFTYSQERIPGTDYTLFQLKNKQENIDFVVADTNFSQLKPILLFCQGSQPVPLFIDAKEQGVFPIPLSNFDLNVMKSNYHVVVISMPHTPLIVGPENLNRQHNYITDTSYQHSYSTDYLLADYAENYINRANLVLNYLFKQKWVDKNKLVITGHSQGARVAVGIAATNPKVTQLGLFGYSPQGRADQAIRQIRKDAERGKISWQKADSLQQEQIKFYKLIHNKDTVRENPSLKSWASFSKSTLDQLVLLKIPIYIAYGSEDIIADGCDFIPHRMIENGKDNLTLKRYNGLEHNFFPVMENGEVDYKNGRWIEVMNTFLDWTKVEKQNNR